jgi:ABC-type transport system involved in cytochrome bd biosynthesis fused ATPase/permease subunit
MERDPIAFVRRRAAAAHLSAAALTLATLPLLWLGLDFVRVVLDNGFGAGAPGDLVPLLRLVLDVPERISEQPLVLFDGFMVELARLTGYVAAGLIAVTVLLTGVLAALAALRASVGTRAVAALRTLAIEAIARAHPDQREEARHAASLVGESLARESGFLGGAVIVPLGAAVAIAVAVGYPLWTDWRLALAAVAGLSAGVTIWPRRFAASRRAVDARLQEGAAHRRSLIDLVRRLPAVRAHGTATSEQTRLAEDLDGRRAAVARAERALGGTEAINAFLTVLAPLTVLIAGGWFARDGGPTAGAVAASALATLVGMRGIEALAGWRAGKEVATPIFDEIARSLASLTSRDRARGGVPVPAAGTFVAEAVTTYDATSGARLAGLDLTLPMPSHVALVGEPGSGAEALAGLIGGRLTATGGRLAFGEVDLADADAAARAARIGYAGGETILMAGTLRRNILYGVDEPESAELDQRLIEAVTVVGLDRLAHARGLAGSIDPRRDPTLAGAVVEARKAVLDALARDSLQALVDPFDPARYNTHATIGENILFGVPVGDTFRETNLAGHPFVRAILDADDLSRPLAEMGRSIAESALEMFADLPEGHPLFERFAFFPASERPLFEDLVQRPGERRRGAAADAAAERLIGLALRYVESRHRLGLMTPDLEGRILAARAAFARLLPTSLSPAITFHDPEGFNPAANLQDNLLFGRIAQDRAGAERDVRAVTRRVLTERGLDSEVMRIGLDSRVDPRGDGLTAAEIAAVDLARCLLRRPDIVVAETILTGHTAQSAQDLLSRLRRALVGRGLIVVTGDLTPAMNTPPLDRVIRFDRASIVPDGEDGGKNA